MTHYEGQGLRATVTTLKSLDDKGRPIVIRVKRATLVDVLVHHQRRDGGGGCHCGAVKLGESYPEHVADVIQQRSQEE